LNRDENFLAYFEKSIIPPHSVTLYILHSVSGWHRKSKIHISIRGGNIGGANEFQINTDVIGYSSYHVDRDSDKRLTVEANMDSGRPIIAIIPESTQPLKLPAVVIRVSGNLQDHQVEPKTYPLEQFEFQINPGVRFRTTSASLDIEQLVDGKVCEIKSITLGHLTKGDEREPPAMEPRSNDGRLQHGREQGRCGDISAVFRRSKVFYRVSITLVTAVGLQLGIHMTAFMKGCGCRPSRTQPCTPGPASASR